MSTTTMSTKGQVILPKATRDRLHWGPGTRLAVEEHDGGVTLRPVPLFPPTRPEDVFGMLPVAGPARTVEEMNASVLEEARRRHARD